MGCLFCKEKSEHTSRLSVTNKTYPTPPPDPSSRSSSICSSKRQRHTQRAPREPEEKEVELPPLQDRTIWLVQGSWEQFSKVNSEEFQNLYGVMIFAKLFELSPDAATLFSFVEQTSKGHLMNNKKMHCQVNHVLDAISTAVANLAQLSFVVKILQRLGGRHANYNMKESYFESIKIAIVHSLESALGEDLTEEHKAAWKVVLDLICEHMLIGFRKAKEREKEKSKAMSPLRR